MITKNRKIYKYYFIMIYYGYEETNVIQNTFLVSIN